MRSFVSLLYPFATMLLLSPGAYWTGAPTLPPTPDPNGTFAEPAGGELSTYRGAGFSLTYPAVWRHDQSDTGIELYIPDTQGNPVMVIQLENLRTKDEDAVFSTCRSFFGDGQALPRLTGSDSAQTTLYGAWRGKSISFYGDARGAKVIVSCTAIHANDSTYAYILSSPQAVQWTGFKIREAIGNTVTFDRLPPESHGNGKGACRDCASILSDAMTGLTAGTLAGMR